MEFGKKKKDAPERGNGIYLRRFAKGETKVRFLDEMDEWIEYWEHFTPDKKSFPCTEDRETCPGCTSENEDVAKASRKYATYVQIVKTGQVFPIIVPVSLADRLSARAEKNGGTIVNRDYAVMRSGTGFDTEYDVDQEDKYPVNLDELRGKITVQIQDCFKEAYEAVWGADSLKGGTGHTTKEHVPGDENPPTEPAAESTTASGEDNEVLTEAKIRAMDKAQLRDLCDVGGVDWEKTDTEAELVEKLLAKFGTE